MGLLLYDFSFLPAEILALAFSAFQGGRSVACATVSADFHIKAMLLRYCFLHGV